MSKETKQDIEKKKELFLESPSGFMMPFAAGEGEETEEVEISLGYGEQVHPNTGEKFFHHGVDFVCPHKPLYAIASGTVIGVGQDGTHDKFINVRYGKFDVKYGHIDGHVVNYGSKVNAGQQIAVSGDFLHIGVTFDGEDINPIDFLTVILSNIAQLAAMGIKGHPQLVDFDVPVRTKYEADQEHIIEMMFRFLPQYIAEIQAGTYRMSDRADLQLRNAFSQSVDRNYFFENLPSYGNPLGLSGRSAPLVSKVQDILIGDFLAFMASRHNMYVPTWDEAQKKNLLSLFL